MRASWPEDASVRSVWENTFRCDRGLKGSEGLGATQTWACLTSSGFTLRRRPPSPVLWSQRLSDLLRGTLLYHRLQGALIKSKRWRERQCVCGGVGGTDSRGVLIIVSPPSTSSHMVCIMLWAHQGRVMTSLWQSQAQHIIITARCFKSNPYSSLTHTARHQETPTSNRSGELLWRFIGHIGYTDIMHIYSIWKVTKNWNNDASSKFYTCTKPQKRQCWHDGKVQSSLFEK